MAIAALTLLLTTAPAAQADDDPAAENCLSIIEDTKAEFRTRPLGVPAPIAAAGFQAIYGACYVTDPSPVPVPLPIALEPAPQRTAAADPAEGKDGLEHACEGGGVSALGWANYLEILGDPFHVLNSPASSQATFYTTPKDEDDPDAPVKWFMEGYARSTLDDITATLVETDEGWAHHAQVLRQHPHGGQINVHANCLFMLLTSTDWTASGLPMGVAIINLSAPVLKVRSTGTTCIIPC